jgi:hypothetical protein
MQSYLGDIGAGSRDMEALQNQVSRAFTVRLRFEKDAHEVGISAVYVMASGTISSQAKEYISEWCSRHNFGENAYYLDGETLDRLEKSASLQDDRQLRMKLRGLLHECLFNDVVLKALHDGFKSRKIPLSRCRTVAIEQILVLPPPGDLIKPGALQTLWNRISLVNKLADYHMLPMATSEEEWGKRLDRANETLSINQEVQVIVLQAITKLDSQLTVAVRVVEN